MMQSYLVDGDDTHKDLRISLNCLSIEGK